MRFHRRLSRILAEVYHYLQYLKSRPQTDQFNGLAASEAVLANDWIYAERGCRMGKPIAGDVVVFPFPQTDLKVGKPRPALVLVSLPGDDLILCQITSQAQVSMVSRLD